MAFDPRAAVQAAIASGAAPDQTKVKAGGGDYTPPKEGPTRLRFVGYFEIGKQKKVYKGQESYVDKVQLVFELSGKNHPPVERDGVKYPVRITETMTLSQSDKAAFMKVFKAMNYDGKATHMAELLGESFLGHVYHDKWTGSDGKERVTASLRNDAGYSIKKPFRVDEDDNEVRVTVDPPLTEIKAFLWNFPSLEMWNSLFIPGEYEGGKTKNVIQEKIKSAQNFVGSAMYAILQGNGEAPDIPDAEKPGRPSPGGMDIDEDDDIPF